MKAAPVQVNKELTVYIELADMPEVVQPVGPGGEFAGAEERLAQNLDKVGSTVLAVCRSLHEKAYTAMEERKPEEFTVKFGVTLAGEAGVPLVTKGSVECAFKVTATWKPQ
jgi:Trypsin-co-occurring domain 1